MYALNASSGTKIWSYSTGGMVESSPAVANGIVYIGYEPQTNVLSTTSSPNWIIYVITVIAAIVAAIFLVNYKLKTKRKSSMINAQNFRGFLF